MDEQGEINWHAAWRKELAQLQQATEEQEKAGAWHNVDSFPGAALAASALEPSMSAEQATKLLGDLHPTQRDLLWGTCLRLNRGDVEVPKSRFLTGSVPRSNAGSGEPLPTSASLDPSSSDG